MPAAGTRGPIVKEIPLVTDELETELAALRAEVEEQRSHLARLELQTAPPMPRRRGVRRRGLVLGLIAALVLVPGLALAAVSFSDVPSSSAYYADIQAVATKGIMNGCGSGKFCPTGYVTNEKLAAYLNRLGALSAGKTPVVNANRLNGHTSTYYAPTGYATGFAPVTAITLEPNGAEHTLMSLTVPTGHYIVSARLQGVTGSDSPGNSYRFDCVLEGASAAIDAPVYRVGEADSQEVYMTFEGKYVGAGPITLVCSSANGHTVYAQTGSMTAVKITN